MRFKDRIEFVPQSGCRIPLWSSAKAPAFIGGKSLSYWAITSSVSTLYWNLKQPGGLVTLSVRWCLQRCSLTTFIAAFDLFSHHFLFEVQAGPASWTDQLWICPSASDQNRWQRVSKLLTALPLLCSSRNEAAAGIHRLCLAAIFRRSSSRATGGIARLCWQLPCR